MTKSSPFLPFCKFLFPSLPLPALRELLDSMCDKSRLVESTLKITEPPSPPEPPEGFVFKEGFPKLIAPDPPAPD